MGLEGVWALLGVIVGGVVSELGQHLRDRREAKRRRYQELVELYTTWVPGMQDRVAHWTSATWSSKIDLSMVQLKLDFLEGDAEGRRLRFAVWATLPDEVQDAAQYEAMKEAQHTATSYDPFVWPEFDKAMTAVIEHVRNSNPDGEKK